MKLVGYMTKTERGYHPANFYWPVMEPILQSEGYVDLVKVKRVEAVEGSEWPIVVLYGPRDVLREFELRYDTAVRNLFPDMAYDDLKKLNVEQIKKAHKQ